ncbi:MAG: nucleotide sugar dehydrogenase [Planctomycetia bacterium]|nr:nucleotide sugar dehydrogenase [Planctomycetia bacterium]
MTAPAEALRNRLTTKDAVVGIIGLGYVGLPLARAFVEGGFPVLGFDTDPAKVARLQQGESYLGHVPAEQIRRMRERSFAATDRFERLGEADAILICVPTPLTDARHPDLTYIVQSCQAIAARLRPGQLVILESTTYPGTTRDVVQPLLEGTGLKAGSDFFLAYSPEREDPGNPRYSAATIPKVVGGVEPASLDLAAALYGQVVPQVVPVTSCEVAEASKLLENIYRAVNIALVNEFKVICARMQLDVWEVIEAAKTKPFGFQPFYPGPGLGGHCIPIDPFYFSWVARKHGLSARFIELAGEINTAMPAYVMGKIIDALNDRGRAVRGSRILLLGMAYKRDVDDPREAPGFELLDLLLKKGAEVAYNDPHIPRLPSMRRYPQLRLESQPLTAACLGSQDGVVIVTDHAAYDWDWVVRHAHLVIDTRNATRNVGDHRERIVHA